MSDHPKYRQRGYQDSDNRGEARSRGPQGPPPPKKEGPRGRGLGAPTASVFRCAACGEKRLDTEIPFDATCAKCGADLHSCSNCMSFDTSVRWECRKHEEIPARVAKKRDRNDCTFFSPKVAQEFGRDRDDPSPGDARSAFDALFKL